MKTFKKVMALTIMAAVASAASAQVVSEPTQTVVAEKQSAVSSVVTANSAPQQTRTLTNVELSTQYKLQMDVINNEIKTLKSQQKLYKADPVKTAEITSRIASKKAEMADVKAKKKIADQAIKTEKASQKAAEKAEKAKRKAEAAAQKAAQLQK